MQKVTTTAIPPEHKFWYKADTEKGRLERRLIDAKVFQIGTFDEKKYRLDNGDTRYPGVDLNDEQRALRTSLLKNFEMNELKQIHEFELRKYGNFLSYGQMCKIVGRTPDASSRKWNDDLFKYLVKFNDDHRPVTDREFMGVRIPPYFYYDAEFDGMTYHHSWDNSIWYADINYEPNFSVIDGKHSHVRKYLR